MDEKQVLLHKKQQRTPEFLAINPLGKVPALQVCYYLCCLHWHSAPREPCSRSVQTFTSRTGSESWLPLGLLCRMMMASACQRAVPSWGTLLSSTLCLITGIQVSQAWWMCGVFVHVVLLLMYGGQVNLTSASLQLISEENCGTLCRSGPPSFIVLATVALRQTLVCFALHAGDARLRARVDAAMDWHHMTIRRGCTAQVHKPSNSWTFLITFYATTPAVWMQVQFAICSEASLYRLSLQCTPASGESFVLPTCITPNVKGSPDRCGTGYLRLCPVSRAAKSRHGMVRPSSEKLSRSGPP